MDRIKKLSLLCLFFSFSTLANDTTKINVKNLYGTWNCTHTMEEKISKMNIKIDYNIDILRNGKSTVLGTVLFKISNFPELKYNLSDSSNWKIKEGNLVLSSTELEVKNQSYPELEKILNLKSLFPKKVNESVKILELTKAKLKVWSRSDGGIHTCSKIVLKN
jgi:hypothetical protein